MPFSAIWLVFKFLMFSCLQVCKFTDLQVHNSIDCPYFYGLSVKISDLLHMLYNGSEDSNARSQNNDFDDEMKLNMLDKSEILGSDMETRAQKWA